MASRLLFKCPQPVMPLPEHCDSMDSGLPVSSPAMSNEPCLQFDPELSFTSHKRRRSSDSEMPGSTLPQPAQPVPTYPPSQPGPFGSLHHVSREYDPSLDAGPSFESYRRPGPSEAGPSDIPPQQIPSDPLSYPDPDDTGPFFSSVSVHPFCILQDIRALASNRANYSQSPYYVDHW